MGEDEVFISPWSAALDAGCEVIFAPLDQRRRVVEVVLSSDIIIDLEAISVYRWGTRAQADLNEVVA